MDRKSIAILVTAMLLITLTAIITFVTFSTVPSSTSPSEVSPTEKKGLAFIENVLPLDVLQYNITLNQSRTEGYAIELEQYTLESDASTLDVSCHFENNILRICMVYVENGSVISDRSYNSINDAAISFLINIKTTPTSTQQK